MTVVDTHTHFYDPTRPEGVPWPPPENELLYRTVLPEHFRAVAAPEGVDATVVVEASRRLEDNQWLLDLAAAAPIVVGIVGGLVPNRPEFPAELDRFAADPLFRGIRVGGALFEDVNAGSFLADMKRLADAGLSLDLLAWNNQFEGVMALADAVPYLTIVINHVAHISIDGQPLPEIWRTRYRRLADRPNIYMKVSALMENSVRQPAPENPDFYRPLLDELWQSFGNQRLIYGSNWPVCERAGSYAQAIGIVRSYFAEKGTEAEENYFGGNAKRAYGWIER